MSQGKLSRTKGASFERKVAGLLRDYFPESVIHRTLQRDGAHDSDVVIGTGENELAKRLWIECEDARNPDPKAKMAQAEGDSRPYPERIPVCVWHKFRERKISVTLRLRHLLEIIDTRAENRVKYYSYRELVTLEFHEFFTLIYGAGS